MTYDNYTKHPLKAIELKLNMSNAKNPHLLNSLNGSHHPIIPKFSHIDKVENQDQP